MGYSNPYSQFVNSQGKTDWANVAAGTIGQIAPMLGQGQSGNPYDFSVNSGAAFSGMAQGFATGGPVGAAVGAVSGMLQRRDSYRQANDRLRSIDGSVNVMGEDVYGRPTFNSQEALTANEKMSALTSERKRKKRGLRKLFAGGDDRVLDHGMGLKVAELDQNLQSGRNQFNSSMEDYNAQQLGFAQYNNIRDNTSRLKSLYSIGTNLY